MIYFTIFIFITIYLLIKNDYFFQIILKNFILEKKFILI